MTQSNLKAAQAAQEIATNARHETGARLGQSLGKRAEVAAANDAAEAEFKIAAVELATNPEAAEGDAFTAAVERIAGLRIRLQAYDDHVLPEARKRHDDAIKAEAEAGRWVNYHVAAEIGAAATKRLMTEYPALFEKFNALKTCMAAANDAAARANADLPDGVRPLHDPEAAFWDLPQTEREIVADDIVEAWAYAESGAYFGPADSDAVKRVSPRTGFVGAGEAGRPAPVELRKFRRVEYRSAMLYRQGPRLAQIDLILRRQEDRAPTQIEFEPV